MRAFGHSIALMCFAVVTFGGAQSPTPDQTATVLTSAREALGGDRKLAAVRTIVATGRTRQVRGDNLVPIEFEIAIELPDKYVRRDEIPAQESGPTTAGFSGDTLLQFPVPGPPPARAGGPPPPTPEQIASGANLRLLGIKQDFARLALGMFASSFSGYPLQFGYLGKAEAPQGKADVLEVKGPPGAGAFVARLFVNADTHLPIMIVWQGSAPMRGGAPRGAPPPPTEPRAAATQPPSQPSVPESRLYFADYREVSGLQLPFRLRRALGPDTVEETTFDGYKINAKIDPKKFEVRK